MARPPRPALRFLALAAVLGAAAETAACNVPVFRYALERWEPDYYELRTPAGTTAGDLGPLLSRANVDVAGEPADGAAGWVLRAPRETGAEAEIRGGAGDDLARLLDSPARREIARRLVSGESAVFVLAGDPADPAVAEASRQLAEALPRIAADIGLPPLDPYDPADQMAEWPPLRIAFSVLALDPADPAEQGTRDLLTFLLPEDRRGEPYLFPVFGRGRVLGAIPLGPDLLPFATEAAGFLCGPCSCQVKDLNPGWDLLLAVDWDALLAAGPPGDDPAAAAEAALATPAATPPAATLVTAPAPAAATAPASRLPVIALLGAAVLATAGGLFLLLRPRPAPTP